MRVFGVLLVSGLFAFAAAAQAAELRVPKDSPYAFHVTVPKGWHSKFDAFGGLLMIPPAPSQHAMIYLAVLKSEKYRNQSDSVVAADVARLAGVEKIESQKPAKISGRQGTAYFGIIVKKAPRYERRAKIVLLRLAPDTWAQQWVVTQPGMNYVELNALNKTLDAITLTGP
jgi:hypothetical protein